MTRNNKNKKSNRSIKHFDSKLWVDNENQFFEQIEWNWMGVSWQKRDDFWISMHYAYVLCISYLEQSISNPYYTCVWEKKTQCKLNNTIAYFHHFHCQQQQRSHISCKQLWKFWSRGTIYFCREFIFANRIYVIKFQFSNYSNYCCCCFCTKNSTSEIILQFIYLCMD